MADSAGVCGGLALDWRRCGKVGLPMTSMPGAMVNFETEPAAPSPWKRVWLAFGAPSRAFAGPGVAGSWWAPYLLLLVVSLGYMATVGARVGWETVARNNLANSPKQQARLDQVPPQQQAAQVALIARITRIAAYVTSAIGPLVFAAIVAGLLLATLNFGLGAHGRFGPLFAVYLFSALPQVIKLLLVILILFLGAGGEAFQINNPLGSNPAFYMQGSGAPHWLASVLSWVDVFVIWQLVLLTLGCAMVAKVSRGKAAIAVLAWTAIFIAAGATLALLG